MGVFKDRRFGENDPQMTPEERSLQRFLKEREKGAKKRIVFNLEDSEEEGERERVGLPVLLNDKRGWDDFDNGDASSPDIDRANKGSSTPRPLEDRRRSHKSADDIVDYPASPKDDHRPRSKKQVMEEVIAKSKLLKYERQKVREDDIDLRAELDQGLSNLRATLQENQPYQTSQTLESTQNETDATEMPDQYDLLEGKARSVADKEYDEWLRQLILDKRAQPTERTLTEDERLEQHTQKLRELENARLQRMRGESESNESSRSAEQSGMNGISMEDEQDKDHFGLGDGLGAGPRGAQLDVEDEDDFLIENDLIASSSELDWSEDINDRSSVAEKEDSNGSVDDWRSVDGSENEDFLGPMNGSGPIMNGQSTLPFVFDCPQTLESLLNITRNAAPDDLPTIVRRIRALHHPKLSSENKAKLSRFASVLVDYLHYLSRQPAWISFEVLEQLVRHVHSLAKTYGEEVGRSFRSYLRALCRERSGQLTPGDLLMLTAIGTIFPTSDHFHPVTTPAMLCMTRYLSQKSPEVLKELAIGTYVCTLCLQYQRLSQRYVPEVVRYLVNALDAMVPAGAHQEELALCSSTVSIRLALLCGEEMTDSNQRPLSFIDTIRASSDIHSNRETKYAILQTLISLTEVMASLWMSKSAFFEVFSPVHDRLARVGSQSAASTVPQYLQKKARETSQSIGVSLQNSLKNRKPLRLHNHRPLPIKTSIPKFEEVYNPDRHYDPDPDRAALSKLRAEHKKERKGALRELRKDANFMARHLLREKKEQDAAYEKKFKRLVAEVQGEEAHEGKAYEKEKLKRTKSR